jgi:hypothetical protein
MSGGLLPARAAGILVVNCSFWIGTFWIVTPGCEASNPLMAFCHTVRSVPDVALFHQVSVTGAEEALVLALADVLEEGLLTGVLELLLLEEPPLLHAAAAVTVAAAMATAASARLLRMNGHLPERLARGRRAAF